MNEGDVYNIVVVYKHSYTVTPRCNVNCGDGGGAEDLQMVATPIMYLWYVINHLPIDMTTLILINGAYQD